LFEMASTGPGNVISRRVTDDSVAFSGETTVPKYMKFFLVQKVVETRHFVNRMREEADAIRSCIAQTTAVIVELQSMEDQDEVHDSLLATKDAKRGEESNLLALHELLWKRLADIPAAGAGPPSYQCSICNATMWYNKRSEKSRKAVTPSFSLCCQDGKVLLPRFNDTPQPLKKLLDYNDPTASKFKDQIRTSAMAKSFRMAKEWCRSHGDANFGLRLLSERTTIRQYNAPTIFEVSVHIINDFGDDLPIRDIVVNKNNIGPQHISELHPSYMALQYPLLFPFSEDGYHENIPYNTNKGTRKTKRGYVTMKEYDAYIIQQRQNQGTTLLRGGRLFQQYLVDAFTAIEEQRLNWTRKNQDALHVDLYHNLCDAVTRGDTSATELGKRIVLPWTYVGSPRYMIHNYEDAMALCRTYGNPNMFVTFTSNPKWPKIAEMLAYIPGQKSHDRPERPLSMKMDTLFIVVEIIKSSSSKENLPTTIDMWFLTIGPDRETISIQENVKVGANGECDQIMIIGEIKNYLTAGAESFTYLKMVNKINYATFKAACFAYGLLNDDKEWTHAIAEANHLNYGKRTGSGY
nr:hypothetical protein CTI12_AA123990 [Tanacetum cinerariifolium]